ncbi:MAG: DUF262 domain-containing protein, partial [Thermoguttaceae bacterium]|nr:DUF262 domain-containing protein [Thermoguttaceae bacterium]
MTDQFDCNSSARSDNRAESKVKGLDACEMTLEELLAPEDEQSRDLIFAVPVYQRHYKWGKTECKKLIEDVLDITKLTDKTHYFGSILVTKDRDSQAHNELTLIDGQQRLVTLGLLLAALRNAYNESDEEYKWLSKILEVGGKTRIKPYVERAGIFNEIVLEKKRPEDSDASQMAVNYHIFEEEVNKNKEEILRGIKCLGFVLVELDPEMAQQVFSSINMTGVRLSNADLIHNFVLTGLGRQDQENIERLWRDIENNCQDVTATNKEQKDYLEDFWYYYLLFYLGKREKDIKRGGYELFENFRKTFENKMKPDDSHPRCEIIKGLCLEWREYSEYFNKFLNPTQISSQEVRRHICYLKRFNNKAVLSLLLGVYKDFSNDVISEREMVDVLILLESLFVRRSLVFREKWPSSITTVYHKIINTSAYKQIKSNPSGGIDDRYSKKIASRLNGAFPRISVLDNALGKVNFYESSITGHILERINDLLIQDRVNCTTSCNIKTDPDYSAITIEHIFPQDPKADWSPATGLTSWGQLGKQVQREYKDRLNRLGNLTLLTGSDNSSVKNKPFSEKLQTYKGSEYLMTNDMCEYPEWTCDNIDLR